MIDYRLAHAVLQACKPAIATLKAGGVNTARLDRQEQAAIKNFERVFLNIRLSDRELNVLARAAGLWESDLTVLVSRMTFDLAQQLIKLC